MMNQYNIGSVQAEYQAFQDVISQVSAQPWLGLGCILDINWWNTYTQYGQHLQLTLEEFQQGGNANDLIQNLLLTKPGLIDNLSLVEFQNLNQNFSKNDKKEHDNCVKYNLENNGNSQCYYLKFQGNELVQNSVFIPVKTWMKLVNSLFVNSPGPQLYIYRLKQDGEIQEQFDLFPARMILVFNCNYTYRIAKNFSLQMKLSEFKRMVSSFFSLSTVQVLLEFEGKIMEYMDDYKQMTQLQVSELGFHDGMSLCVLDKVVHELYLDSKGLPKSVYHHGSKSGDSNQREEANFCSGKEHSNQMCLEPISRNSQQMLIDQEMRDDLQQYNQNQLEDCPRMMYRKDSDDRDSTANMPIPINELDMMQDEVQIDTFLDQGNNMRSMYNPQNSPNHSYPMNLNSHNRFEINSNHNSMTSLNGDHKDELQMFADDVCERYDYIQINNNLQQFDGCSPRGIGFQPQSNMLPDFRTYVPSKDPNLNVAMAISQLDKYSFTDQCLLNPLSTRLANKQQKNKKLKDFRDSKLPLFIQTKEKSQQISKQQFNLAQKQKLPILGFGRLKHNMDQMRTKIRALIQTSSLSTNYNSLKCNQFLTLKQQSPPQNKPLNSLELIRPSMHKSQQKSQDHPDQQQYVLIKQVKVDGNDEMCSMVDGVPSEKSTSADSFPLASTSSNKSSPIFTLSTLSSTASDNLNILCNKHHSNKSTSKKRKFDDISSSDECNAKTTQEKQKYESDIVNNHNSAKRLKINYSTSN
eukprot:403350717